MLPGNWAVWWFYQQQRGLIFNGMGGLDAGSIEAGFSRFKVPLEMQTDLYQKLLILAQEILRERKEE